MRMLLPCVMGPIMEGDHGFGNIDSIAWCVRLHGSLIEDLNGCLVGCFTYVHVC